MPPCFDVYVWVHAADRAAVLCRFVERHVDPSEPGDPRFAAFLRTHVEGTPAEGDADALAELQADPAASPAFSLYLRSRQFHAAIVTLTVEGDIVLGLSLDDPQDDPAVVHAASGVLARLMEEFEGTAGVGGVELPPPRSRAEWREEGLVVLRAGSI